MILPALSHTMGFPQLGSTSIIVNLTGLDESIHDILGFSKDVGFDIVKKVVKTANDVLLISASIIQTNLAFPL